VPSGESAVKGQCHRDSGDNGTPGHLQKVVFQIALQWQGTTAVGVCPFLPASGRAWASPCARGRTNRTESSLWTQLVILYLVQCANNEYCVAKPTRNELVFLP
jgi:hypothetical protein